jgi:hypothetical protein
MIMNYGFIPHPKQKRYDFLCLYPAIYLLPAVSKKNDVRVCTG